MKNSQIIIPKIITPELAEFIGILAGDGYIAHNKKKSDYIIEIVGDKKLDKEYLENYVSFLIYNIFNTYPKIYQRKDQNTMILRINSKEIYYFLFLLGFPSGKKNNFNIPKCINDELMLFFIRGLADTDFSLNFKKRKLIDFYPVIKIRLISSNVIKSINSWLSKNGFKTSMSLNYVQKDKRGYNSSIMSYLELNGRTNFSKWMELIGFRNKKHLVKIKK